MLYLSNDNCYEVPASLEWDVDLVYHHVYSLSDLL